MDINKQDIVEEIPIPPDPLKKNKGENKAPRKNKGKRFALIGLGIIVGAFLLSTLYLFMNTFEINYEPKTVAQFWVENKVTDQFITKGNEAEMSLPDNVVNTELMVLFKKAQLPNYYKIDNVGVDYSQKRIHINGSLYGIKLPISMSIDPHLEGDKIFIELDNIMIGKGEIKLKEANSNKLKSFLFKNSLPIMIDTKTLFASQALTMKGLEWSKDGLDVVTQINDKLLIDELKKVKNNTNPEILNRFENSEVEEERLAAKYVIKVEELTEQEIESLVHDILSESKILNNILLISEQPTAKGLFEKYGTHFKNTTQALILEKRIELMGSILSAYRDSLFEKLNNNYFPLEAKHINKGQLYSVTNHSYFTVEAICKEQNVNIPEATLKRLAFYYDKTNQILLISYKLDEETYLIINEDQEATISKEAYLKNNEFEDTGRVSHVKDRETWDSIEKEVKSYFQAEEIYVRYMKADDKYAFVVASPKYNYQTFKTIAFEKVDGAWVMLDGDIQSITDFNKKYPTFNLETATMEIEKVTIYNLSKDMYAVILEDLVNKGVIEANNNFTIEYCSYGNVYIDFKLSNGKEYVYKVYSMYLQAVYDKETAEKTLEDLPEILTLQEAPSK
ncbi:MAG: hypothetical protein CVU84_06325 [Firmicutes bacterium HGW-Firmicutes-1]|jgi:hypothetical protein|nr:MAG: hypothetical protein CVU84_06325 [Firmicutes bacterium HGW-Firmicutes-1]